MDNTGECEVIEILDPVNGPSVYAGRLTFKEIQEKVGGFVKCVHLGQTIQVLMNEDGLSLGLPYNRFATERFHGRIDMWPGAVGVWLILSGKDLLE
jgi:hypothetical protein